jgi:hypothetical protein
MLAWGSVGGKGKSNLMSSSLACQTFRQEAHHWGCEGFQRWIVHIPCPWTGHRLGHQGVCHHLSWGGLQSVRFLGLFSRRGSIRLF